MVIDKLGRQDRVNIVLQNFTVETVPSISFFSFCSFYFLLSNGDKGRQYDASYDKTDHSIECQAQNTINDIWFVTGE